jgi:glycosyltransferase involved in cell wall biosynthesis
MGEYFLSLVFWVMGLLSVVIITYNEEGNIARCIDSVKNIADEIVVLDAYSTDRTVEIASAAGAIVKQDRFAGFIQQKNKALSLASNDYVLSLDADEALDEQLVQSISHIKTDFRAAAYTMNRCTNYCGRFIRRGTWYPDRKMRLFNRHTARWAGVNPHDRIELAANAGAVQFLQGDILHYSFDSVADHVQKSNSYSSIAADAMFSKGKKSSWFKMMVNPLWEFIHGYFIRLGFMEGFEGFVIAINSAHATFLKYVKLYQLQKKPQVNTAARARRYTLPKRPIGSTL